MEPHWTAYLTAFSTPVLVAFGGFIAYRQWATARDKLRLDLFDRRLKIYETVKDALSQFIRCGEDDIRDGRAKFLTGVAGAQWLFGEDVHVHLKEVVLKKMNDHIVLNVRFDESVRLRERAERSNNSADDSEEYKENENVVKQIGDNNKWFRNQENHIDLLFMPYLSFQHKETKW